MVAGVWERGPNSARQWAEEHLKPSVETEFAGRRCHWEHHAWDGIGRPPPFERQQRQIQGCGI